MHVGSLYSMHVFVYASGHTSIAYIAPAVCISGLIVADMLDASPKQYVVYYV